MNTRYRMCLGAVLCALVALLIGTASQARATYPGGRNGRIAFGRLNAAGDIDIYSVRPNGHGLRQLTHGAFDACAAYSADGRRIAFCRETGTTFDIWTMNANGTHQHRVSHAGNYLIFPDFSPNGRLIAAGGARTADTVDHIFVVSSRGGRLHPLTTAVQGNNDYPAFSPNGKKIAFISDRTGIEQVWVMNSDGSHQHPLTSALVVHDQVPDWSPNGERIAFEVGEVGSGRIWVMNANGSDQHQVTHGPGDQFAPAWSPRGGKIAFVEDLGGGDRPVVVVNANGTDEHPVHPGGKQYAPAWQPQN